MIFPMHKETFDIITSPCGNSTFSIPLACASVETHYMRTTGNEDRQAEICSTGLRVYEGAQVLSSFLVQFSNALLGPVDRGNSPIVIELGCGCGLVGFSAAHIYKKNNGIVVFTDASEDCLNLVHSSGSIQDVSVVSHNQEIVSCPRAMTFPLNWSSAGVKELKELLKHLSNSSIRLILGSDIMYYRVDIDQLVTTIEKLLHSQSKTSNDIPPIAVLCHFMRIPEGRKRLLHSVHNNKLGIVKVDLAGFLEGSVVCTRGWGGLETLILFQKSSNISDLEGAQRLFAQRRNIFRSLHQDMEGAQCDRISNIIEPYEEHEEVESLGNVLSIEL